MKRRLFEQIRVLILLALFRGQSTINKLANDTEVNWKTVQNHLTFLMGKGFANEIFSSQYVRIFEITPKGKAYVKEFVVKNKDHASYIPDSKPDLNNSLIGIIDGSRESQEKEETL